MKSDIQIAQETQMLPIKEVAAACHGITEDDLELYGKYKAKLSDDFLAGLSSRPDGKSSPGNRHQPHPRRGGQDHHHRRPGRGHWQRWARMPSSPCVSRPSARCFGIKGGAAGGGYAQVVPMEDINLHFTGDFHAITAANNLLARAAGQPHPAGQRPGHRPPAASSGSAAWT